MRRALALRLVAGAAALSILAAGCFGGGDGDPDPLSKEEYLAQADAICRASAADVATIAAPSVSDVVAVEAAIAELVRIQRRALAELRELPPPEADEPGVDVWLDTVARTLDEMDKLRDALLAGDAAAVAAANQAGGTLNDEAEALATDYGLRACAGTTAEDLTSQSSVP